MRHYFGPRNFLLGHLVTPKMTIARHKLTLSLILPWWHLPGLLLPPEEEFPQWYYFGLDLPNLIEKFRMIHTEKDGNDRMEVYWKGEAPKYNFIENKPKIQARDWIITEENEAEKFVKGSPGICIPDREMTTIQFTLERRRLTGPLFAEAPYIHS